MCETLTSSCGVDDGRAAEQTLVEAALEVLNAADPFEKARMGEAVAARWLRGDISRPYSETNLLVPDRPARFSGVKLVPSRLMPKLGKGGSLQSRQAMLHSLVHTESWAIDLSWDIIARFGKSEAMPREFFTDFVRVAQDEGRHFTLLEARLRELGSYYGEFLAHDGLWDSAIKTFDNLLARLAIEHCVHEARGLDVLPITIARFRSNGDVRTANLLETVVYPEEITHCAAGIKWFRYISLRSRKNVSRVADVQEPERGIVEAETCTDHSPSQGPKCVDDDEHSIVIPAFHSTVRRYFRGFLKPPFNEEARRMSGFASDWYEPLSRKEVCPTDYH